MDALAVAYGAAITVNWHLHSPRASAWSLHHNEPAPISGKVTRRLDEQNSFDGR